MKNKQLIAPILTIIGFLTLIASNFFTLTSVVHRVLLCVALVIFTASLYFIIKFRRKK